jgi:hypothetical protein
VLETGKIIAVPGKLELCAVYRENAPAAEETDEILGKERNYAGFEKLNESAGKYVEAGFGERLLGHRLLYGGVKKLHETVYFKLQGLAG